MKQPIEYTRAHWKTLLIPIAGALGALLMGVANSGEESPKSSTQVITDAVLLPYLTEKRVQKYRVECVEWHEIARHTDSVREVQINAIRKDLARECEKSNLMLQQNARIEGKLDGLIESRRYYSSIGASEPEQIPKSDSTKPCSGITYTE